MNILLLNGGKSFGHSHGELNATLHEEAKKLLTELGHSVQETHIDAGYDIEVEIEKYLWMDAVIYQMPGWWMGGPWIVKKYIDEVFTLGHGKIYQSDGRHRVNPTEGYGTGGLLQGRKHMLSLTWNAPIEAFTRKGDFFDGVGGVYLHFHKANEFVGTTALPTFICNDVIKSPNVPMYLENYRKHLMEVFGKAEWGFMEKHFDIRPEIPADAKAVARVIKAAFTGEPMSDGTEADLVARLREDPAFVLSLVAEKDGDIIGHILFSEALISGEKVLALAPLSVSPEWQKQGVGTALIKAAHQTLEQSDYPAVVVLGHADYYARFGYEKAADYGINAPFDVPEEALRVRRLKDSPLPSGVIQYAAAFGMESF